jgi:kumamolisin
MAKYVPLAGSNRELLPDSRPAGPIDRSRIASLTIHVRSGGDMKELEKQVQQQASLPLSQRTYLTHDEFAKQYGSRDADMDAVEQHAQQHDLMVVRRSATQHTIILRGTLGNLLAAFPAEIRMYHHSSGQYRGRHGEIQVPQDLAGIVTGVFGYDTRPKHRAPHHQKALAASGPGGDNGEAATFFAKRYNFPTSFGGTTLDGTGQTIAIIELGGGYRRSDLKVFFHEIGVPTPRVVSVLVDGATNNPTTPASDDGEVMLDIEVAGAVAPKANFVIYFGPNDQGDKGFLDAISAAVHDTQRKPSVISISWGGPERGSPTTSLSSYHNLFVAAAALGITVCVAAGDHGTADQAGDRWDKTLKQINVDHPSVDDLVLSCGGTQIDASNRDVVWNDGTPFGSQFPGFGGWATGGGISTKFAVPAYQSSAGLPVSLDTGNSGRGVPDIAMSATNYFTRVDTSEGASGGTSAVAPLMAALVALLNQAKNKRVGFLNPFLYANVSKGITKDVTTGSNAIKNEIKGYEAGTGWDACTGLGTPDGTAILNNL